MIHAGPLDDAVLSAFEESGVGTALVSLDGICLRANRALARLLGGDPETLAGERCPITHGESEYEREIVRPDGSTVWLLVTASAARDAEGRPRHLVVHAHDITARKEAEVALRTREAQLRAIFEDAGVGLALTDADGCFLDTNSAHASMYGYEPGSMIGEHFTQVLPEHIREGMKARHAEEVASGVANSKRELPIRRADGSPGWALVDVSFARDAQGNLRHGVAQVQDITERKLAEGALDASRARYRTLVEHLPMAIFSWALQGDEVVYVSPQIEAIFGDPAEDWVGGSHLFRRRLHPDEREQVLAAFQHSAATGDDVSQEFRMTARDGRTLTIRAQATVVLDDAGQPLYMQGYLQDISEQRRLEEQLRLAQKLESIGQLAAGIAHEINTPVQFIGDTVRFVQEATEDLLALVEVQDAALAGGADGELEKAREIADVDYLRERLPAAFDRTADGIRRVADIVRAMRDFAHPDTGEHEAIDINAAVHNTLVVARSEYRDVADVETDLGDVPPVRANGSEINQVLINVLVNAAHAIADAVGDSAERGTIRIRTRCLDGAVAISIADTGCGIPEDVRARIFDPFFTTKEVGRGTGQGLAITRSIVHDRHGGTIAVDSEIGHGTTIEIRLPLDTTEGGAA